MAGPFVAHPFLSDPLFILLTEHGSPVPDQRRSLMIATTPNLDSAVLVDGTAGAVVGGRVAAPIAAQFLNAL